MITEISVENFLSIKERVTLSLESTASKKLQDNLIEVSEKESLLKSVAIYGANASGKSNIIKAIFFVWNMIKQSHSFNVDVKIPRIAFKLDPDYANKPSVFEIIFIHQNIKYKYGFSCTDTKIIKEYLFYWPNGRESQIFNRINTNEFEFTIDKPQQELIKKQMNENVLYLSRATQLGYEKTKLAYEFFINNVVINYSPIWADLTIKKMYEDEKFKNKVIEILQKADFGGIYDLSVRKNKQKVKGFEFKIEKDGPPHFNPIQEKEEEFYDIKFVHKASDGKVMSFEFGEESGGTLKTLSMLGPILDILESGKIAFIDEFELELHPNITRFLVRLFNNKNNKNAQLIITTHDTNLLDGELFRKDQIYICSKEPNKNTKLSSMADFDLRESADFERAYLNGRVGGLPFIDETFFD
jgi:hypothetical protein